MTTTTFHPMGLPLRLTTNSPDILHHAHHLWHRYHASFDARPARLHITVAGDSTTAPTPEPPRLHGHLVTIAHSHENLATADLAQASSVAWLTADVATCREYTSHHFLEPLAYLLLDALHLTPVHAAAIARDNRAILLCGDSGAGKTTLAYACARRGWHFLSGDVTHLLRREPFTLVGRPHEIRFRDTAAALFPELAAFPPRRHYNGKLDIALDTAALGITPALTAAAAHIVFLHRGPVPRLEPMCATAALTAFEQVLTFGTAALRRKQRAALRQLVTLPIHRLTYANFDSAEHLLRDLLHRGPR